MIAWLPCESERPRGGLDKYPFSSRLPFGVFSSLVSSCKVKVSIMAVGFYTLGVAAFAAIGTFFFGFDTVSS